MAVAPGQPAAVVLNAKAPKSEGKSLESFLASLTVASAVFILEMAFYVYLKTRLPGMYTPEVAKHDDTPDGSVPSTVEGTTFGETIITRRGIDAYLFLRYLHTLLKIFIPLALLMLPVLVSTNVVDGRGTHGGVSGLDQLSWTNVSPSHTNRYWVHLVLAIFVVVWVGRIARIELLFYTRLRHKWLLSSSCSGRISTTTILVTDIPKSLLAVHQLHALYDIYPHGVHHVSLNQDHSKLRHCIQRRDKIAIILEGAETRLIQKAHLSHARQRAQNLDWDKSEASENTAGSLWKRYLDSNDRETLRVPTQWTSWLPSIPWVGKVVDKISYCRSELESLNREITQHQTGSESQPPSSSALICFNHPLGAHLASQTLQHFRPHTMIISQIEESSESLVWDYISMRWWERYLRAFIVRVVVGILIVLCTVPVAFTGLLSQLSYLTVVFPRLFWLNALPASTVALLQGVLPACLLATVMYIVPILLYLLLQQQGSHSRIAVELSMQEYYFYFLFVQLFLIVSVSSSIAALLNGLSQDFTSVAGTMAQNLPKAGNYFFSYMILQAFSVSAGTLLQTGRLFLSLVGFLLDTTARQKWQRRLEPEIRWGTFFPVYTNLAVIGLIYSVVSPLILVFNVITFSLFLAVQRYNISRLARFDVDTGGLIYPKAISQLFFGLYVMECYLIGLFLLVRDERNQVACVGQGVIMIIVTFFTAGYQVLLNQAFRPLFRHLPVVVSKDKQPIGSRERSRVPWYSSLERLYNALSDVDGEESEWEAAGELSSSLANTDPQTSDGMIYDASATIQNKDLIAEPPVIWLPCDPLGLSKDAIKQTQDVCASVLMSDENAELGNKANVCISGDPPGISRSSQLASRSTRSLPVSKQ